MITLKTQPLTKQAFAPFGDVIETQDAQSFEINHGTTTRFHDLAQIQVSGSNAKPLISIARCQKFSLPYKISMVERHPLGSQAFIPITQHRYLVGVAEDDDGIPVNLKAFIASGNQGVNYHTNTWHFTLTSFDGDTDFLIIDRGGDGNNLEEYFFDEPFVVI